MKNPNPINRMMIASISVKDDERGTIRKSSIIFRLLVCVCISVISLTICVAMLESSSTVLVTYKGNTRSMKEEEQKPLEPIRSIDDEDNNNQKKYPKIAWLLSFPNSGTSFTMTQVKKITGKTTASNYVKEIKDDEHLMPVNPTKSKYGPFAYTNEFPSSDGYVLTKTHCGGYAAKRLGVLSTFDFLKECAHVKFDGKHGHSSYYHPRIVDKAIHLFRNPFDNIVSRFHLETHRALKSENGKFVRKYPNNREGFRNWCRQYDYSLNKKSRALHKFLKGIALEGVLCYLEFFKYVHWHNNAFHMIEKLNIPSLTLQ